MAKKRGSEITERLVKEIRKGGDADRAIIARLGDENGTVQVGRGSRVYVTLLDNGDVIEVLNRRVPGIALRQVRIGIDRDYPNVVQVLGYRDVYEDDDGLGWPQDHHTTHEWKGHDQVWVSGPQMLPLLVLPHEDFEVRVYGWWLATTTGFVFVNTQDVDLSASQPSAGALYVLLQVADDGTVSTKEGSEVDTKELLTGSDIPAPDAGMYPLAAVRLYDGQEEIRCDRKVNDIVDLRFGGYAVAGGAGSTDVTLDADADAVLKLTVQELGLDTQAANRVWAGPDSGADAVPTFRALTADDIPALPGTPVVIVDTEAVILAATPTAGLIAYGTDTQFFYVADGTNWQRASLKFYTDSANPDMGYLQNNSKDGYYATFITDKYLYNCVLQGYNGTAVNGAIRINTSASPDTLEIYMRDTGWYTIIYDLSMTLGYFVHYPFSATQAVKVWNGMSVEVGLNGRPMVNEYAVSMGPYPPPRVLYGGTF